VRFIERMMTFLHTQDVAIGVVDALIVSFLVFCAAWLRNYFVRRKYPVGGKFVTHFEDVVAGNRVMLTSISRLKQRGRRLTGTNVLKDGRTWLLDGSIVGIGHISGVYRAEATDDEGVGAFYLRISGLVLEGLWSGYDHRNKTITYGRYIFKRMLRVRVRPLQQFEAPAVLAVAETVFGPNYLSAANLNGASGFSVFAALYDRKLVGFAVIEKAGSVSGMLHQATKLPMDVELAEKNNVVGIIRTIAVVEEFQGHGIGEQLFLSMEQSLRREGKSLIAVPAWKDDSGVHLSGILSGNGYSSFLTCDRYWKKDCDNGAFACKCRQASNQCVCDLVWYKKAVTPISVPLWRRMTAVVFRS
jgi:GNAT superfamily N-acetyltransferase